MNGKDKVGVWWKRGDILIGMGGRKDGGDKVVSEEWRQTLKQERVSNNSRDLAPGHIRIRIGVTPRLQGKINVFDFVSDSSDVAR